MHKIKINRILASDNAYIKLMSDNSLRYGYYINGDGDSCEFTLYAEIGEMYKQKIDVIISAYNLRISQQQMEYHNAPWLADMYAYCNCVANDRFIMKL